MVVVADMVVVDGLNGTVKRFVIELDMFRG